MHYQITRNGQTYGPYTLEDLQRYVASGNVLPTDLAKSEEMTEWIPVSQLLTPSAPAVEPTAAGDSAPAFSNPGYANPGTVAPMYGQPVPQQTTLAASAASAYPDAPNLHWGLVLLFGFLTCGLFMIIWNLVIAAWLRRVQPNANALFFYLGMVVVIFINIVVGGAMSMSMVSHMHGTDTPSFAAIAPMMAVRLLLWSVFWAVHLVARYSERASLQEHFNTVEPVGLALDPVMTFFFGGVYFQSQLNRINLMKQAARFGGGQPYQG
jgi:hypothetical protein